MAAIKILFIFGILLNKNCQIFPKKMSLEDKLENIVFSDGDDNDVSKEIGEISILLKGNFRRKISLEYDNIIDVMISKYPIKRRQAKMIIECVKKGLHPKYVYYAIYNYLNDFQSLKVLFIRGYDLNTSMYNPLAWHPDQDYPILYFVKSVKIAYLFLVYGANPSLIVDKHAELVSARVQNYECLPRNNNEFYEKTIVWKSIKMEPIVKTAISFVMATCIDNVHFKETMIESLWPRLRYYLFSEFY